MKNLAHGAVIAALVALAPAFALGQAEDRARLAGVTVAELKRLYLECDKAAMRGLLGPGHAAQCSVIYEELKRQAFDGDFDRFLAWSRTQGSARKAGL